MSVDAADGHTAQVRQRAVLGLALSLLMTTTGMMTPSIAVSATVRLMVRDSYIPGLPLLVRVELRDDEGALAMNQWDAEASLFAQGGELDTETVTLRNGVGSALVILTGNGEVDLRASVFDLESTRTLANYADSLENAPTFSGDLGAGLTRWSGVVRVTSDVRVPEDAELEVLPGTLVLLDGQSSGSNGTDIDIFGAFSSLGTEERPVTFTCAQPSRHWGELDHYDGVPAVYRHTVITRAGRSPGGGHTFTGPAIRPRSGSVIDFDTTSITDLAGKAMYSSNAILTMDGCHFARSVMGPELRETQLLFENGSIVEMFGRDDNDGIYLNEHPAEGEIVIRNSIVAAGDDDAVDTLDSRITLIGCVVRDFVDKGVSVFHAGIVIKKSLIVDNGIGVSVKTDNGRRAPVEIDRSTIIAVRPTSEQQKPIGIQARDKNGEPNAILTFEVTNSIIRAVDPIWNDYPQYPERIDIRYTDIGAKESWFGTGNFDANPLFVDSTGDFRLRTGSPCIDAGDPSGELDADGTRADQGALPVNQEGCALVTRLSDYPVLIAPGAGFEFSAEAVNACERALAMDEARLAVSGTLQWSKTLYAGRAVSIAARDAVGANIRGRVPAQAPTGFSTVCVSIHRNGDLIDTGCFQVGVR